MQAEIFLESCWSIMFLLGDWHTRMNMLHLVYKVFWTNIIGPMKLFLGWKRITKDVCGCYFQAARLVRYIHNSISTYLLQCFVSGTFDDITHMMESHQNANVLCYVASASRDWLSEAITSADQHLCVCAHFMCMSGNFLDFSMHINVRTVFLLRVAIRCLHHDGRFLDNINISRHIMSSSTACCETISIQDWRR